MTVRENECDGIIPNCCCSDCLKAGKVNDCTCRKCKCEACAVRKSEFQLKKVCIGGPIMDCGICPLKKVCPEVNVK